MSEKCPISLGDAPESDTPQWDPNGIREALDISHNSQILSLPSPSAEGSGNYLIYVNSDCFDFNAQR